MNDKESTENRNETRRRDNRKRDMEEMGLDFHLQFPEVKCSDSESTTVEKIWPIDGSTEVSLNKNGVKHENKDVLVILLGWAGAQDKYLSKYSDFYLKRGCIVLRFTTPVSYLFWEAAKLPDLAQKFVDTLQDLQLDAHPTFFHLFSNGGAFTYSYLLRELSFREHEFKMDLRGTIFDSAPAPRHLGGCFYALSNILGKSNLKYGLNYLVAGLIVLLLILQVIYYHMKSAISFCCFGDSMEYLAADGRKHIEPLENWLNRISRIRNHSILLIYSDKDDLIPPERIEVFGKAVKSRGNYVESLRYTDTEHVQHYRQHPDEYIKTVTKFIRKTMMEKKDPTILWKDY